jgi:HEPN domain-containing protein
MRGDDALRWLKQAEIDLAAARNSMEAGYYEWACFQAQQSAEKALKAVFYALGYEMVLTHSVTRLLRELSEKCEGFKEGLGQWGTLDKHYISTRYPDHFPDTIPAEVYDEKDAERALALAHEVMEAAKKCLQELKEQKG